MTMMLTATGARSNMTNHRGAAPAPAMPIMSSVQLRGRRVVAKSNLSQLAVEVPRGHPFRFFYVRR